MAEAPREAHGMHTGRVAAVLGGLALVIVLCAAVVYVLANVWDAPLGGANSAEAARIPAPQLESAPQIDRARYFGEKEALLHRYEWIDREKGVARIPIEVAIAIVATQRAAPSEGPKR
jgi:hypothetical protein